MHQCQLCLVPGDPRDVPHRCPAQPVTSAGENTNCPSQLSIVNAEEAGEEPVRLRGAFAFRRKLSLIPDPLRYIQFLEDIGVIQCFYFVCPPRTAFVQHSISPLLFSSPPAPPPHAALHLALPARHHSRSSFNPSQPRSRALAWSAPSARPTGSPF